LLGLGFHFISQSGLTLHFGPQTSDLFTDGFELQLQDIEPSRNRRGS